MAFIGKPILPKLAERLKIRQDGTQTLEFSPVLVPTLDIDNLIVQPKAQRTDSAATTRTDVYTVPTGKIWRVKWYYMYRGNTASGTVSRSFRGTNYELVTAISLTTSEGPLDISLTEGESITFVFGTGTSGSITSAIHYDEYDLQ